MFQFEIKKIKKSKLENYGQNLFTFLFEEKLLFSTSIHLFGVCKFLLFIKSFYIVVVVVNLSLSKSVHA